MPRSQRAGMLCNQAHFQMFAAQLHGGDIPFTAEATAYFLRVTCGVVSRKKLDTDPDAADRFDRLLTEYDAWRGKIARPE